MEWPPDKYLGPPGRELPFASADNQVLARALADIGWLQPASSLPVLGQVLPVMVVGGNPTPNYYDTTAEQVAARLTSWSFTVPTGYTWELVYMGATIGTVAATASLGAFQPFVRAGVTGGSGSISVPWGPQLATPPGAPQVGEMICGFTPVSRIILKAGALVGMMYTGVTDATGKVYTQIGVVQRPAP